MGVDLEDSPFFRAVLFASEAHLSFSPYNPIMFPTSTRAPHDRFHSPPYPPYPYLNNHMDPHAHGMPVQQHFIYPFSSSSLMSTSTTRPDFRAFYPYCPGEGWSTPPLGCLPSLIFVPGLVKHRKRTSSAQLKVLESVFKSDTKPNAAMRKELAQQLEMTTRGVQVRFASLPTFPCRCHTANIICWMTGLVPEQVCIFSFRSLIISRRN